MKSDGSTGIGKTYLVPVWNTSESFVTINKIKNVLLKNRIPLTSFWTRTIYGTLIQQLFHHSTTLLIGTSYTISRLKQYSTNPEQTYIRCSFDCNRWRVKGWNFASALLSFKEITYRTDEWTKKFLRLKSWVIFGSPEQWMDYHRLWWLGVVIKCSYLI